MEPKPRVTLAEAEEIEQFDQYVNFSSSVRDLIALNVYVDIRVRNPKTMEEKTLTCEDLGIEI